MKIKFFRNIISFLLLIYFVSCAPFGLLYTKVTIPRSYRSPTPSDTADMQIIKMNVEGTACARSILLLVAFGNAGYDAAVKNALEKTPGANFISDVKVDSLYKVYGGPIYYEICTKITGNAVK